MRNKKGMEMTIGVVIGLAIALVTMAVVVGILFKGVKGPTQVLQSCEAKRGICEHANNVACIKAGGTPLPGFKCSEKGKENNVCCYPAS